MRKVDIARAWKDEEYRLELSDEERARLPEHPAGRVELGDAQLEEVAGAAHPIFARTIVAVSINSVRLCPPASGY